MFRPFKFSFAMDNSAKPGAVSEKLVNSYLSQSIPIFFGGVDIPNQLNQKAFVHCNITYLEGWETDFLQQMRTEMGHNTDRETSAEDEIKYNYTRRRMDNLLPYIRPSSMPCIEQIMELDQDDEKYKTMLAEPLIHKVEGGLTSRLANIA